VIGKEPGGIGGKGQTPNAEGVEDTIFSSKGKNKTRRTREINKKKKIRQGGSGKNVPNFIKEKEKKETKLLEVVEILQKGGDNLQKEKGRHSECSRKDKNGEKTRRGEKMRKSNQKNVNTSNCYAQRQCKFEDETGKRDIRWVRSFCSINRKQREGMYTNKGKGRRIYSFIGGGTRDEQEYSQFFGSQRHLYFEEGG